MGCCQWHFAIDCFLRSYNICSCFFSVLEIISPMKAFNFYFYPLKNSKYAFFRQHYERSFHLANRWWETKVKTLNKLNWTNSKVYFCSEFQYIQYKYYYYENGYKSTKLSYIFIFNRIVSPNIWNFISIQHYKSRQMYLKYINND